MRPRHHRRPSGRHRRRRWDRDVFVPPEIPYPSSEAIRYEAPFDYWHFVGEAGEPALQNGWTNWHPAVWQPLNTLAFYRDERGFVFLRGMLNAAAATGAVVFYLPEGFRPTGENFGTPGNAMLWGRWAGEVSVISGGEPSPTDVRHGLVIVSPTTGAVQVYPWPVSPALPVGSGDPIFSLAMHTRFEGDAGTE